MDARDLFRIAEGFTLFHGDFTPPRFYLFDVVRGDVVRLNRTSYEILSALDGGATFGEAVNRIVERYDVDREQVERDIMALVEKSLRSGALLKRETS